MGNKLLFCFWYFSLWLKEKRKYPALWTGIPSNLSPEVEDSHLDVVCVPILEVWGRVISGQKWSKCWPLVSWILTTNIQPHLDDHCLCYSGGRCFFLSFPTIGVLPFHDSSEGEAELLSAGRQSNFNIWSILKLFKENNFPFSLLYANIRLAFENLSLLRCSAGTCEFWCCMEVGWIFQ